MITDNVTWLLSEARNKNAFFARAVTDGRLHLIAGNRAARRMLMSGRVWRMAHARGAVISVDKDNKLVSVT